MNVGNTNMKTLAICSLFLALMLISLPVQSVELKEGHPTVYIVKKGDFLEKIASNLGVSVRSIVHQNSLQKTTIFPGQKIYFFP